ncbi:TetR/AcrR family transcriptional regulator [Halobacteriovorax sp. RZ-1]|uniref:TetR/AcrR family transcriptional regulator n=1 Tax=unclassified Halobacteriovorax TaxID=2639665 RepID=UPI00371FE7DC
MRKKSNTYHHGALKESILLNASQIIAENGSVDFSIRDISNACKVSPAAIYKHFKSRNEIAVKLALQGVSLLKEEFDIISNSKSPGLLKFCKAYINFAKENEGHFRAIYFKKICSMDEFQEVESITDQLYAYLLESIDTKTKLKKDDYKIKKILACIHGVSFLIIDNCAEFSEKEIDKILKDII